MYSCLIFFFKGQIELTRSCRTCLSHLPVLTSYSAPSLTPFQQNRPPSCNMSALVLPQVLCTGCFLFQNTLFPFGTLEPLLWSALQASGCCPSARWLCLCLSPLHPPPSLVPCVTVDPQCFVSRSSRSITEFPQRTRFKHSGSQSSPVLL